MTICAEQALLKARIRRWRNIRSGWIVVGPTQIMVYRQKLVGGEEEAKRFEVGHLIAVESDNAASDVVLTFNGNGEGNPACETFSFARMNDAQSISTLLAGMLSEAEERERKRQKEETLRLEGERQERERRLRDSLATTVWNAAEAIWSLVKADYLMTSAVIDGDWKEAGQQYSVIWRESDKLKETPGIELEISLKALDNSIIGRKGEEAIEKAGLLLGDLADKVMQTDTYWEKWQENEDALGLVSPNWNHVPYFLLFAAGHFESVLSSKIADWTGVDQGLSVLQATAPVIKECFGVALNGCLETAYEAGSGRDSRLIADATKHIEGELTASFKSRRYNCSDSEFRPEGGHDGPMPQ